MVLGTAMPALAQSRRIQGAVVDDQDQPVAGAEIEAAMVALAGADFAVRNNDQTWRARTNASGDYIVTVPSAGEYVITAMKDGVGRDQTKVRVRQSGLATANLTLWNAATAPTVAARCGSGDFAAAVTRAGLAAAAADPGLARLLTWLEAVHLHVPGCGDSPAIEVGRWGTRDLEELIRDVRELARFLQRAEEERAEHAGKASLQRDQAAVVLYGRRFTADDLERRYNDNQPLLANDLLLRGAVLHADVGIFVPGTLGRYPLVEDGGRKGWREGSRHWEVGRRLLESIQPSVGDDAGALLWYRAVSAHLFRAGNLAQVAIHLNRARETFPQSPSVLIDSAYLHQELSSAAVQGSLEQLRASSINVTVGSRRGELQRAERFLREALAMTPGDADARMRLGHTLVELGRHEEAAVELRKAIDAKPDTRRHYLTALFLGRAEQALGRHAEARRLYEIAADLYPGAQSPRLALSQLARQTGNRSAAQQSLRRLAAVSNAGASDPWWQYYEPHKADAELLLARMRQLGRD